MTQRLEVRVGERFGFWTIIRDAGTKTINGLTRLWVVAKCDCGTTREVMLSSMKLGKSKSCGCTGKLRRHLIGQRFGRLNVIRQVAHHVTPSGRKLRRFAVNCDCGKSTEVLGMNLVSGNTQSCGCLSVEMFTTFATRHGDSIPHQVTDEYRIYRAMIARCENPNVKAYPNYGGRGIRICSSWRDDYRNFLRDMGRRPSLQHSIERVDVDGNYDPSNCRWATRAEQNINRQFHKLKRSRDEKHNLLIWLLYLFVVWNGASNGGGDTPTGASSAI
jgi:hypothetical protein